MRTILLGTIAVAISLFASGCAKQESEAQRNAEIERRVQERLADEHRAEAEQKLALRAAALEARERMLAAQESSFATMVASAPASTAATDETTAPSTENYSSPDYATYPAADDAAYGYVSPDEPVFADEPYYVAPDPYYVTVFNQNAAVIYSVRNRNRGRFHHHPPHGPSPQPHPRQMGGGHPTMPMRPPMRNVGHGRIGVANNRPAVNRSHTIAPRRPR
jgi:hypothetical protein